MLLTFFTVVSLGRKMLITAALALKQISAEQEKVEGPILQTSFIG